jgi:small GTP-binding protein
MSQNGEYKLILIGNAGVGKTSIFRKLSTGQFTETNISTIGVEKKTFFIDILNKKKQQENVSVILFDTAGQEKFRAITKNYFRGSDGILLIYDITEKNSFEQVEAWIDSIKESIGKEAESKYIIFLIGNKLDLINQEGYKREVE